MKLMCVVSVDFHVIYQILITYSAFVRYRKEGGLKWTEYHVLLDFKKA